MTLVEALYQVYGVLYDIWIEEKDAGQWPEEDLDTIRELRIDIFNLVEFLNRDRAENYFNCP